jgi:hypothetical protein
VAWLRSQVETPRRRVGTQMLCPYKDSVVLGMPRTTEHYRAASDGMAISIGGFPTFECFVVNSCYRPKLLETQIK